MRSIDVVKSVAPLLLALTFAACGDDAALGGGGAGEGAATASRDGDCLSNAEEEQLGTDPELADTDGDGLDDCAERDCGANPVDPAERCYACGWKRTDPGTLVSTGAAEGDVIANLELIDQCEEPLKLWDFAGEYHILFMTSVSCSPCRVEAGQLEMKAAGFTAESGIPLSYIIIVNEDVGGDPPAASIARSYASSTSVGNTLPVTVDPTVQQVLDQTPWMGDARPGKCVLSPEMVMLTCYSGEDDAGGFAAIVADAAR